MKSIGKVKMDKNTGMVEIMRVTETEELCRKITETINYYKTEAEEANKRASEYEEEANKSHNEVMDEVRDEMRRKDEEIARMPFRFSEVESNNYKAFVRKHDEKGCSKYNEGFSISFVNTDVGNVYKVKCNNCSEEEDITDFEMW